METLATQALKAIEGFKANKVIMAFVRNEAIGKVAGELREQHGGGTTAKAAELLSMRHVDIAKRVDDYINLGLIGCFMAAYK